MENEYDSQFLADFFDNTDDNFTKDLYGAFGIAIVVFLLNRGAKLKKVDRHQINSRESKNNVRKLTL